MKILYFSLFITFFFQLNFYAQGSWYWQHPYPQGNDLNDFCSNNIGSDVYSCKDNGIVVILSSSTWIPVYANSNENLCSLCFRGTHGCAVGNGGVIFRTTDGGTNWNLKNSKTSIDLRDIILSNSGAGNAAMIYNDSIVKGYSAITNTYSALAYNGALVTLSGYFC